jgi:hypothetical protein
MLRSAFRPQRLHRSFHTSRFSRADASKVVDSSKQAASTVSSDTSSKAAANAQEYANKALEQSQKVAQIIGSTTGKVLGNAGPRVNGIVTRFVGLQNSVVYWSKVVGEVAKQGNIIHLECVLRC